MPSYYVAKKNRCPCDLSGNCACMSPFNLTFATQSSLFSLIKASKIVNKTNNENKNIDNMIVGKGEGNIRKLGSGGNSYSDYLAKKRGVQYCDCN
jgi:hypothetical protein